MRKGFFYLLLLLGKFLFVSAFSRCASPLSIEDNSLVVNQSGRRIKCQLSMILNKRVKNECTGEDIYFSGEEVIKVNGWIKNSKVLVHVSFDQNKVIGKGSSSGISYKALDNSDAILQGLIVGNNFTSIFLYTVSFVQLGSKQEIVLQIEGAILISLKENVAIATAPLRVVCE